MKKIALLLALSTLSTLAIAGSISQTVTINGTVLNSCEFDSSQTSDASFDYEAANGSSNEVSGGAVLYCNAGTMALPAFEDGLAANPTGEMANPSTTTATLSSVATGDSLVADVSVSSVSSTAVTDAGYVGADKRVYTVAASADAGQWSAASASDYTGSVTIHVDF